MRLSRLIDLRRPTSAPLEPEDIFSSSLGLFSDLQNQHGENPDTVILYNNARHGQLEFRTADVNGEEQRRKFAHYLWNAGVLMGELVGGRAAPRWSVQGERVLELGAGVGLGGIVSALAGAKEVAITDYPAPPIIRTLTNNVMKNIPTPLQPRVTVQGHLWGSTDTPFETSSAHRYTRILAADCLWMPWEHANLARSMLHFLAETPDARILCIAGFHTGRAKVAPFFEEAVPQQGLAVEEIFEMDADGARRPWMAERDGGLENVGERKKWLILARIQRANP
ncbi:hypothetical protein T440DRAFT_397583 [Plenodomus tracheiphilus IPT5]|uniref:Nicotinamide N-methyltransferase n=1 Tax=Plenodomus tracheiphilus IPT5 TaxID=1408161 RepID=A0A6A7B752_9PLEO|nr:hypothetical protein T440DRAFT_397583 [Plenodomus tracheiphilus IPT5]